MPRKPENQGIFEQDIEIARVAAAWWHSREGSHGFSGYAATRTGGSEIRVHVNQARPATIVSPMAMRPSIVNIDFIINWISSRISSSPAFGQRRVCSASSPRFRVGRVNGFTRPGAPTGTFSEKVAKTGGTLFCLSSDGKELLDAGLGDCGGVESRGEPAGDEKAQGKGLGDLPSL